jgi:hypothetical protein
MGTSQISLLAGLVKGYTGEKQRLAEESLKQQGTQRDQILQYLGHLATNPNIPPEHQQWALGKAQEIISTEPGKKLPKIDLGELPPASVPGYTRQQTSQAPQMTLQPPIGPGGGQPSPQQAPAAAPVAGDVGRASDNTVNALGAAIQPPVGPAGSAGFEMPVANVRTGQPGPVPGTVVGGVDQKGRPTLVPDPATQPNFNVAPPTSGLTIPAGPATTIQNPVPPVPISPKGQLHVLTPGDKAAYASAAEGQETERLRQQYPGKSPEDLAYFAKHGEFPKDEFSLSPGEARYKGGKEVARNTAAKPGEKSGYSPHPGPAGEPMGVIDNKTGAFLSPAQAAAIPEAKSAYDASVTSHDQRRQEQVADQKAVLDRQFALADEHEQQAMRKEGRTTIAKAKAAHDIDYDRLGIMEQNYEAALNGDQQAMLSLLSNHVGMTLGLQKGARITKAFYEEAQQSAPWLQRVGARFDDRGYLSGVVLAPDQMSQMVELGKQKEAQSRARLMETQDSYSDVLKEGGKGAGKAQLEKPQSPDELPPQAAAQLQEGHETTFSNGQVWTKREGRPVKVR